MHQWLDYFRKRSRRWVDADGLFVLIIVVTLAFFLWLDFGAGERAGYVLHTLPPVHRTMTLGQLLQAAHTEPVHGTLEIEPGQSPYRNLPWPYRTQDHDLPSRQSGKFD